jgi:NAD(P)H-dependent flavin oxidoreductase YrpB (nitropropane dioxygenase family)
LKPFNIGELTIPVPIIQGGMGIGISLSGLASAVANMGGIGVISTVGIGLCDEKPFSRNYKKNNIHAIRAEIRKAREKSLGVLGVNIMSVITDFAEMVKTSIEEGIDIIFSGAGLPLDLPKYLINGAKTKLVPIVSSSRAATIICNKWKQNYDYLPDALVVEGPEAGGHLGFKNNQIGSAGTSLEILVKDVLGVATEMKEKHGKEIPVIAAGGIFTGGDIYRILETGASAVQMGTRFVATEECDASDEFKQAFIRSAPEDIRIIKSPVGMPGRAFYNQFLKEAAEGKRRPEKCKNHCIRSCDPKTTSYCISEALLAASRGNLSDGFVFTGSNGARVNVILTVKNLFAEITKEYQQAKKKINKLWEDREKPLEKRK